MLLALADLLNASDKFHCLYVNIEGAQTAREDEGRGMKGILGAIGMDAINTLRDSFVEDHSEEVLEKTGPDFALAKMLTQ